MSPQINKRAMNFKTMQQVDVPSKWKAQADRHEDFG
jgi:hypothetical protein